MSTLTRFEETQIQLFDPRLSEVLNAASKAYYCYNHPTSCINTTVQEVYRRIQPKLKEGFQATFYDTLLFSASQLLKALSLGLPIVQAGLEDIKNSTQFLIKDLFEAFVMPLAQNQDPSLVTFYETLGLLIVAEASGYLARKHLNEPKKLSESITYGAQTGALAGYIMDQNLYIATLAGALVGLLSDSAAHWVQSGALNKQAKKLYLYFQIEQRVKKAHNFLSQGMPYVISALCTASVYAKLSPMIAKLTEQEPPPHPKWRVIQVLALSSFLVETSKIYARPLLSTLGYHLYMGARSIKKTGVLLSWSPRILSILCFTSIISRNNNIKN